MTEDEIQERLRQTCVELKGPKGHLGSGYVIARDRVGTANHVVRDWSDKDWYDIAVGWGADYRRKARARVLHRNTKSDAALLEVVGVSDLQALPVLNDLPRSGRPWWGFGFPSVAARAGVATGVPTGGTVLDARWSNVKEVRQLLLRSQEASTGRATPLSGYSGSPVTVNGAVIGHLVEQFDDPDEINRPTLGFVKACPASVMVELLARDRLMPLFASDSIPQGQGNAPVARDVDIAEVFAWCDREAVRDHVHEWALESTRSAAGLLCIVGASSCRHRLLLDRVVDELRDNPKGATLRALHLLDRLDIAKAGELQKRMLNLLGVASNSDVLNAAEFRRGVTSVVICVSLDVSGWREGTSDRALREIGGWLAELVVPARKLLLVVNLRYESRRFFDRLVYRQRPRVHQVIARAYGKLLGDATSALAKVSIGKPGMPILELGDYSRENVRLLQDLPRVREVVKALLDEGFFQWFGDGERSYPEIEKYLKSRFLMKT